MNSLWIAAAAVVLIGAGAFALRGKARATPPPPAHPAPVRRRPELDTGFTPPPKPAELPFADDREVPAMLAGFRMPGPGELSAEARAGLVAGLQKIRMPPASLQQLMSPEFLASGATRELAEFIMREPVLTAKVLARVNSPFYALRSPIVSVQHAITFLGMNAVRDMALRFMLEDAFHTDDAGIHALCGRIWDSATIAAELCVLLSQKLGFADTGASSTQTVLSFVGDFAMITVLPREVALQAWQRPLLERTRVYQQASGLNAAQAASVLLRAWELPEGIVASVEEIGSMLVSPPKNDPRCLRLALCYTCARLGEGIAFGRVTDPAGVDVAAVDSSTPEYHFVQPGLASPAFARLPEHLQAPDTRAAIERMMSAGAR
jgi:HD-like signal output (HDOD) protein